MARPNTVNTTTSSSVLSSRSLDHSPRSAFRNTIRKIAGVGVVIAALFTVVSLAHAAGTSDSANKSAQVQDTTLSPSEAAVLGDSTSNTTSDAADSGQSSVSSSVSQTVTNGVPAAPDVSVTVNGQDVPVSASGTTQTTTTDANGTTTVNLQTTNNGTNTSGSYTNLNVSTNSNSSNNGVSSSQTYMNGVPVR